MTTVLRTRIKAIAPVSGATGPRGAASMSLAQR